MGTVFRFKEFEVDQKGCAMKINTDGVLLGSIVQTHNPMRILDIGTGTGVIALMLAQRFAQAQVDAVEIDAAAYNTAQDNFKKSPFRTRIVGYVGSYEELQISDKYDMIVSNPPFYTNSLHNPDARKKLARHSDYDFFDRLLAFAKDHLTERGQLELILPVELAEYVINHGNELGLNLLKSISIRSFPESEVIRNLVSLTKDAIEKAIEEDFIIYKEKGVYTEAYRNLLKPFFLAF